MLKGVNKTVIEVSNTGSRMFEKIVFYVTPQYGNVDPRKLQKAAGEFSLRFDGSTAKLPPLREQRKLRRRRIILALSIIGCALAALLLWVFL